MQQVFENMSLVPDNPITPIVSCTKEDLRQELPFDMMISMSEVPAISIHYSHNGYINTLGSTKRTNHQLFFSDSLV